MKIERCASTGPPARRATPRLALLALALAALGQGGCQSIQSINPFRNCHGCGPLTRIGSGLGNGGGLFNRNRGQVIYEEPPIILDAAPGVEVLPGAPAIIDSAPPMGSTLVPADPALIAPTPSIRPPEDRTLELEPLPEPSGRAPQGAGSPRASNDRPAGARPMERTSSVSPSSGDPYADRMARRSSDETVTRFGFDPAPEPGRAEFLPVPGESLRVIDSLPPAQTIGADDPDDLAPPPPVARPEPAATTTATQPEPAPPPVVEPKPEPAEAVAPEAEPSPPPVAEPAPEPAPAPLAAEPSPPAVEEPLPDPFAEPAPAPDAGAGGPARPADSPPAVADPSLPAPAESIGPPPDPPAVSDPPQTLPDAQPDLGSASGIGAFHSVAPMLAGGSVPEESGWGVLAGRGYRTVLDLRPVDQIRPADFAASSRLGLRHVLLPMTPETIDAGLVDRFEEELAIDSSRPLFFCDADGSAAAALWYVHRVKVDRADPARARRDAERIAPIPPSLMLAARAFLDGQPVASRPEPEIPPLLVSVTFDAADPGLGLELSPTAPSPTAEPGPAPEPEPPLLVADSPAPASATDAEGTDDQSKREATDDPSVAEVFADPFARPTPSPIAAPVDLKSWGPYAALFLSVLAVPLAYWGSTSLSQGIRTRARASLAAPERRPRSLPPSSDA